MGPRCTGGAEVVGDGGLAKGADVVAAALDGQQRGVADHAGIDLAAAVGEAAVGEIGALEDAVERPEVEFLGQIEHGANTRRVRQ